LCRLVGAFCVTQIVSLHYETVCPKNGISYVYAVCQIDPHTSEDLKKVPIIIVTAHEYLSLIAQMSASVSETEEE